MVEAVPVSPNLVAAAVHARSRAYAPYSNYLVGAAIADEEGILYTGANLESADYTLTTHAEQHALNALKFSSDSKAIALAFAVEASLGGTPAPCGLCRQRLREFSRDMEIPIVAVSLASDGVTINCFHRYSLAKILPFSFGPEHVLAKK